MLRRKLAHAGHTSSIETRLPAFTVPLSLMPDWIRKITREKMSGPQLKDLDCADDLATLPHNHNQKQVKTKHKGDINYEKAQD